MGHSCRETCVCETSEAPQKMLEVAAAALAAYESSVVIESGADIAWQLLCVREKLAIEKQAGHQTCRLIIEALVELGLDLPALVAAPYDATAVNELCKSLPAKVRAVVKQRDDLQACASHRANKPIEVVGCNDCVACLKLNRRWTQERQQRLSGPRAAAGLRAESQHAGI